MTCNSFQKIPKNLKPCKPGKSLRYYEKLMKNTDELIQELESGPWPTFIESLKGEVNKKSDMETMKTDLEKFIELYKSFGINCVVEETSEYDIITLTADEYDEILSDVNTYSDKFSGNSNIVSQIYFDKNGKFTEQSFWK